MTDVDTADTADPVPRTTESTRPHGPVTASVTRAALRRAREFRTSLPKRVARANPSHLPHGPRELVVASWVMIAALLACYVLLPAGLSAAIESAEQAATSAQQVAGVVPQLQAAQSVLIWAVAMTSAAVLSALVVLAVGRTRAVRRRRLLATVVASCFIPVVAAVQTRAPLVSEVEVALLLLGIVLAVTARTAPSLVFLCVLATVCGLSWVFAALQPLVETTPPVAPLLISTGWVLLAFYGLISLYITPVTGITATVEHHHAGSVGLIRPNARRRWAILAVAAAVAVMALRLTIARDLFGAADAQVWQPRGWATWPHAVLVAALIVVAVLRAERRPLRRSGQTGITALLIVGALATTLGLVVPATVGLIYSALTGSAVADTSWGIAFGSVGSPLLVLALIWFIAAKRYRGTVTRWMAIVGIVFLLPPVSAAAAGVPATFTAVWATATQVAVVLVLASVVLLVVHIASPQRGPSTHVVVRMALVPIVTVHAISLVPALVSNPLGKLPVIVAAVLAVVLFMPEVAADPYRHVRQLTQGAALRLGSLLSLTVVTIFGFDAATDTIAVLGLQWLAIPLMVAFTTKTVAAPDRAGPAPALAKRLRRMHEREARRRATPPPAASAR